MEPRLDALDLSTFASPNFRQRVLSALILAPVALAAVYSGGIPYDAMVVAVALLGLREWLRLIDPMLKFEVRAAAQASVLATLLLGAWQSPALGMMLAALLTLGLFVLAARHDEHRAGWVALGIPYMAGSGLALLYLRAAPEAGAGLVYYLFTTVWSTDSGAYIAGRLIGGPKLAPAISPQKTWAGLGGGMALAAILGYGVALALGARQPLIGLALAVFLACAAQVGDLFKSYFKRRAGVKESGALIPGHGGVLDRIDGLVFAAVFFVLFQIAIGGPVGWW